MLEQRSHSPSAAGCTVPVYCIVPVLDGVRLVSTLHGISVAPILNGNSLVPVLQGRSTDKGSCRTAVNASIAEQWRQTNGKLVRDDDQ